MYLRISCQLLFVFLSLFLGGCGSSDKHYILQGRVVSKVPETRTLVVDHDNIPGFMAAMTMPYQVAQGEDLGRIEPGDRIKARIVVKPDAQYWLDRISLTDSTHREKVVKETKQLYPGETIPDVELVNQDGRTVHLSDFQKDSAVNIHLHTLPHPDVLSKADQFICVRRKRTGQGSERV